MTIRVEWFCTLESGFVGADDIAGSAFQTVVAGQAVTVHLPSLPDSAAEWMLARPPGVTIDGDPWYWGSVTGMRGSDVLGVQIRQLALSAELDQEGIDLQATVEDLVAHTDAWWDTAKAWLEVLTGQRITLVGHRPAQYLGNKTPIWKILPDGSLGAPFTIPSFIAVSVEDVPGLGRGVPVATSEILRHCFTFAESNTLPHFPWLLIRDARSLHEAGQYRRAVIDAGSAAEMAVKDLMHAQLASTVPPGIVNRLTQRDLTLGAASEVLKDTGFVGLPSNFSRGLVGVRNRVVHLDNGTGQGIATELESDTAIGLAADVVEMAYPLPVGLTRLW